jgi:hypothetical protein
VEKDTRLNRKKKEQEGLDRTFYLRDQTSLIISRKVIPTILHFSSPTSKYLHIGEVYPGILENKLTESTKSEKLSLAKRNLIAKIINHLWLQSPIK